MKEAVLEAMLTQRVVKTRGEVFTKQLGVQDADLTRDAIVKTLYEVGSVGHSGETSGSPLGCLVDCNRAVVFACVEGAQWLRCYFRAVCGVNSLV